MKERAIYNRIKAALAENGKTNLWLATALRKNKVTVSKWCTNESQPTLETLYQIASILNIDVRTLLVSNTSKTNG
ncbi:helix-turn-helix transcriptional regulator [Flaviaesturariibacter amylovorans]|uniref:Helix-turn-helix transcriptional regulator n=1 Tax=Flaviaesturariibacter amylovorans TaxID=1084520 RepID=A0ABP8HIE1_9BACT